MPVNCAQSGWASMSRVDSYIFFIRISTRNIRVISYATEEHPTLATRTLLSIESNMCVLRTYGMDKYFFIIFLSKQLTVSVFCSLHRVCDVSGRWTCTSRRPWCMCVNFICASEHMSPVELAGEQKCYQYSFLRCNVNPKRRMKPSKLPTYTADAHSHIAQSSCHVPIRTLISSVFYIEYDDLSFCQAAINVSDWLSKKKTYSCLIFVSFWSVLFHLFFLLAFFEFTWIRIRITKRNGIARA